MTRHSRMFCSWIFANIKKKTTKSIVLTWVKQSRQGYYGKYKMIDSIKDELRIHSMVFNLHVGLKHHMKEKLHSIFFSTLRVCLVPTITVNKVFIVFIPRGWNPSIKWVRSFLKWQSNQVSDHCSQINKWYKRKAPDNIFISWGKLWIS